MLLNCRFAIDRVRPGNSLPRPKKVCSPSSYSRILEARGQGRIIFIAPNGKNPGWATAGGEDIAFIEAIIKDIETDLCVDQSSRFATGFSWGGGMSYALACSHAKEFKAVSVLSGGLISGCAGGYDPIAYLGIHRINDPVLPFQGVLH
ncbi:hypothetical protein BBP40_005582 [Aspergillus hancockii]|nr:hypothetical protein BBP40_005582 [Aspergillus hancockii]